MRLDSGLVSSDVAEFDQALLQGRLEEAASVYGGPFLDGFHIDDTSEFEHWLDTERERLARSHTQLLETLAQERESAGDFARAAEWWRRLAAHEPTNDRVALRVMRALDAADDRAGAIQHARGRKRVNPIQRSPSTSAMSGRAHGSARSSMHSSWDALMRG
ncbi:MAG: AfsR/SARP family transcriptional regulator [Gemmatimonadaceae bacterium]